jgi:hypothetical protein
VQSLLRAVEREVVAGDAPRLRRALSALGLDHERRAAGGLDVAGDLKALLGDKGNLVGAQQLLLARDPDAALPLRLSLPLPGGQAEVTIEHGSRGEQVEGFHVYVELSLEKLGNVGVRVVGHQGAAHVSVHAAEGAAAAHLNAAAPALEQAVAAALGRPARISVSQREPAPPAALPPSAETNVYA